MTEPQSHLPHTITHHAPTAGADNHPYTTGLATVVRGLAWDIGLPLVTYYGLHLLGASDWAALLAATAAAGVRLGWVALRDRMLNLFAMVMLVVFGIGLVLALVSGDARFLLLKDSITTGAVGATFLAAAVLGHPLTLAAMTLWVPARGAEMRTRFHTDSAYRHGHLVMSTVWGAGLVAEAAVRVPLIYLLPIDVMVGLSTALMVVAVAGLIGWTSWYAKRVARSAA